MLKGQRSKGGQRVNCVPLQDKQIHAAMLSVTIFQVIILVRSALSVSIILSEHTESYKKQLHFFPLQFHL